MKNKSKQILKTIGAVAAMIAVIVICLFGSVSPVNEIVGFNVSPGASVSAIASALKSDKIIISETLFKIAVVMSGGNVQSGGYDIPAGTSVWTVANMMSRGRTATIAVMIPEGFTVKQTERLIAGNEFLTGPATCGCADGDLFPDTYIVSRGATRATVLELARKKMNSVRDNYASAKLPPPLKNWNDVMTLASIVQKETPKVSEMPLVAGVYLNRLRARMRLQADPTVVYAATDGLGDMEGRALLRSHLETDDDYNTYVNYGLPPSPIANAGLDAIRAVLNPALTDNLYFVADGTGGHKFAKTYADHQKNVSAWRAIRRK